MLSIDAVMAKYLVQKSFLKKNDKASCFQNPVRTFRKAVFNLR